VGPAKRYRSFELRHERAYTQEYHKMSKKRKYSEDYVKFGFTCSLESDGTEKPQCFLCAKVFCNDNMRPAKLQEHFAKVHPINSRDSLETMKEKKARFQSSGTLPKLGFGYTQAPLLEASFKVAYLIAKNKKPHTIGEKLIKPCALEMVASVLGKQQRKQIAEIPLSNDVISSRILDMSADILDQVIGELKNSNLPFALQLDESTDVAQCSQLLAFVKYATKECVKEEFLFCEPLLATTKAADVYQLIEEFCTKNGLDDWKTKLGFICTDGAPAMLGKRSGFGALVKAEAPQVVVTHCFLHRHALASKTLSPSLKSAMDIAVEAVNFIRSKALNHRLFKIFCKEVGAEHEVLLYYTNVRWLSRGRVFTRVMELRTEIAMFLKEKGNELCDEFETQHFILSLAYLADIFSQLNDLNVSIQGSEVTIMDAGEKITAFQKKLALWNRRVTQNNYANFPTLENLLTEEGLSEMVPEWIQGEISKHLENLMDSFGDYFAEDHDVLQNGKWIRNPFSFNLDSMDDADMKKDDLIDLQSKALLNQGFSNQNLDAFWCSQMGAYPVLAKIALSALVPFATTYLCESGFSALVSVKTKSRNRLEPRHDMRLALSKTAPRISVLNSRKQQQPSH